MNGWRRHVNGKPHKAMMREHRMSEPVKPGLYAVKCLGAFAHKYDQTVKPGENWFHVCGQCGAEAEFTRVESENDGTSGQDRKSYSDDQDRQSYVPSTSHTFPIGARVLVDGRDEAIVAQVFPEGSTSLLAPHYCVRFVGGPAHEQVKVSMNRVGVDRKE